MTISPMNFRELIPGVPGGRTLWRSQGRPERTPVDTTPNLHLPYLAAAQAQKHVTHNEALRALDALVQLTVADRDLTAPPPSPVEGARHIVGPAATGPWSGTDGRIAAFQDGAWAFYPPAAGWIAWVAGEAKAVVFDGAAWVDLAPGDGGMNPAPLVGINTTAAAATRLAVKSDAVLFSHDDVTPGSGDVRQVLNKASPGRTVSQLYQSAWSGRAETGLTGDDDFHLKVSPDGATWHEAMVVDRRTGAVRFPATPPPAPTVSSLTPIKTKILAGAADVTILVIGDSTSTATTHWVYRFAQWLVTLYPTHTVTYRLWNDASTAYGAPATLATGTGPRSIRVYNASAGGFHIARWMAGRYAGAIGALTPDLILTNDGVNLWSSAVADTRRRYFAAFQRILLDKPGTPIAITLQHPFSDSDAMDNAIAALRQVASRFPGMTVIDAHARFVEAGKPAIWYDNSSHPSALGHGAMLAEAQRHWTAARDRPPFGAFDPWWADRSQFNLLPNGDLAAFSAAFPDHWGATGGPAGITRDATLVFPGKPHSVRLEGVNKTLAQRIEGRALAPLLGKRLSCAVRFYAVAGHAQTGQFYVAIDGSLTGRLSVAAGGEADAWQWAVVDDIRVPPNATTLDVVLTSIGTGAATGTAHFDEVILTQGEAAPELAGDIVTDLDNPAPVVNLLQDAGRFGGTPEPITAPVTGFVAPAYITASNGATIVAGPKFITNNTTYGGVAGALDPDVQALVEKLKDTAVDLSYGRYGVEFYLLDITAGAGTATLRTIGGLAHYLTFALRSAPVPPRLSWTCHVLVKSGSLGVPLASQNRLFIDGRRQRADLALAPADGWRQITRLYDVNPRRTGGYDNILHNLYTTPGARILLAAPALVAGHIPTAPGYFHGVVPSAEAWR